MTKKSKRKRGKCLKAARDKRMKVLQRRAQLPLGELRKDVRKKVGKFWKGREHFPYGD